MNYVRSQWGSSRQNNTLWSFYFKVMAFFFRNIFAFPNRSVPKLLLQNNITDFESNSEASLVLCRAPTSHLMSWLMRQPLITFCVVLLPKLKRCVPFSTWYIWYRIIDVSFFKFRSKYSINEADCKKPFWTLLTILMVLPQLKKILYFWDRTLGHTPLNRQQDIKLLGVSINVCFWQASAFVIYALPGTLIAIKMKPKQNTKQTSR